jgi:hypothetical protein
MAAGAFLGHKFDEFKHHHGHNQDSGTMAGLLGTGEAGALAAKLSGFFGGRKRSAQASGAANPFYHDNPGGPPPGATTGWGAGSFLGGLTHSGPRLIIHGATYADMDVTAKVMVLVTPDQVLSLACKKLNDEFGDPWPENRKGFNILYQYGDRPLEVWAGR